MDETNVRFLAYGFAAAWAVLCLYVLSLVVRENGIRKQIDSLKRMVEKEPK